MLSCIVLCRAVLSCVAGNNLQAALQNLASMFKEEGSILHLFELSSDSHKMMTKSGGLLEDVETLKKAEVVLQPGKVHYPNMPEKEAPAKETKQP